MKSPSVIAPPESIQQLKLGFDQLAELLASTLGPTQGVVISTTDLKPRPELLTDAATIARRMTELPDPRQNIGAMLLRNMVWRMHERVGDGGALTAVLAQAMLAYAARTVTAGANPVQVINGMKRGVQAALARLTEMSQPIQGEDDLAAVAFSTTGETDLSFILGEMFDILGPLGHITVEDYMAPYLEREYLEGGRWRASLISPYLINSPGALQAIYSDLQVVLFDGAVTAIDEVRPVLDQLTIRKSPEDQSSARLLIVAHKISGEALNLLVATSQKTEIKVIAVSLERSGEKLQSDLADLACLTGAALISPQMGRRLESIRPADLGSARRAQAGSRDLLVVGGGGNPAEIRDQIEILQKRLHALPFGDADRLELEMRLGRLSGSVGTLKVGAYTQSERDYLHQRAEQGVKVTRAALEGGVLPGGGAAFLHCIPAVLDRVGGLSGDESMGVRAVAHSLEAPFRRILKNAGVQAPAVPMQHCIQNESGLFYDVNTGGLRESRSAGVLDAAKVLLAALETAASGAAMALSTDTLILKKNPAVSYEP